MMQFISTLILFALFNFFSTTNAVESDFVAYKIIRTHKLGTPLRAIREQFTEYYSSRQARARIETEKSQAFYQFSLNQSLLVQQTKANYESINHNECKQVSLSLYLQHLSPNPRYLRQLLDYKLLKMSDEQQQQQQQQNGHIFGFAKLISIIQENANLIKQIDNDHDDDKEGCLWKLKIERVNPMFELQLEYCNPTVNETLIKPLNFTTLIPRKVSFKNGSQEDFELYYYPIQGGGGGASQNRKLSSVDLFAFPLHANCSQFLEKLNFNLALTSELRKINFKSVSYHENVLESRQWVAFDLSLGAMRIEDSTSERETISILDFEYEKQFISVKHQQQDQLPFINCYSGPLFQGPNVDVQEKNGYLSQLLFGSSNFAFMGEATVRGARVEIYEATGEIYPIWLTKFTPINTWQGVKIRYHSQPFRVSGQTNKLDLGSTKLSIILYFAKTNFTTNFLGPLLQYEIRDLNSRRQHQELYKVQIFDWNNNIENSGSSSGEEYSNIFALPQCFAKYPLESNVQVVLELPAENWSSLDSLVLSKLTLETHRRNDAFLRLITNKFTTTFAMFDQLKTRIMQVPLMHRLLIIATIKFNQFVPRQTKLQFLGAGHIWPSLNNRTTVFEWYAETPAECLFKFNYYAKEQTNYLMYQDLQKRCVIDQRLKTKENVESNKFAFGINNRYGMNEVFEIFQERDIFLEGQTNMSRQYLDLMSTQMSKVQLQFEDSSEFINKTIEFIVKETSWKQATGKQDNNTSTRYESINNFLGFKLTSSSKQQQADDAGVVWIPNYSVNGNAAAKISTLEQCNSACSSNVNCETYSYCSNNNNIECLLSSINLEFDNSNDTRNVDSQLTSDKFTRLADGSEIIIDLAGNQRVKVIRNRHCSLHRKTILSLFKQEMVTTVYTSAMLIKQVDNLEQCARQCFNHTLFVLQDMHELQRQMLFQLNNVTSSSTMSWSKSFQDLKKQVQEKATKLCQRFFYTDETYSIEQTRKISEEYNLTTTTSAFCLIDQDINEYGNIKLILKTSLESFRIKFENLFERRTDVEMQSKLTGAEIQAFVSSSKGINITQGESLMVRQAIISKRNYQSSEQTYDLQKCATKCIIQWASSWPWCQSFDVRMRRDKLSDEVFCYLNTMTMDSVDAVNLTANLSYSNTTFIHYHYEPRFKLVQLVNQTIDEDQTNGGRPSISSGFILTLGVFAGILTGVLVTFNLRKTVITLFGKGQDQDAVVNYHNLVEEEPDT